MTLLYILIGLLILAVVITIHELGHYLVGKIFKMRITEFAIGFGPVLYKRVSKKTGEVFSLRMIPLGGFCGFEGEDDAGSGGSSLPTKVEEGEPIQSMDEKYPVRKDMIFFHEAHPSKRLAVLAAGAFFNFVSAIIFSIIFLLAVGYYQGVTVTGFQDIADNPNDSAYRLVVGDEIIAVNGDRLTFWNNFNAAWAGTVNIGGPVPVTVLRPVDPENPSGARERINIYIERIPTVSQTGVAGTTHGFQGTIAFHDMGFFQALGRGFTFTFQIGGLILEMLWGLVTGQVQFFGNVGGPVATVSHLAESVSFGFINILILLPLISMNLALFNLLPIPALDGARMVFVGIEWGRGKPINPELEGKIHFFGFIALFGLIIIADVVMLFSGGGVLQSLANLMQWRL